MLVLTRKKQERIQIGDNVTISIIRISGKSVRIGIEAPDEISIRRHEIIFDPDSHSLQIEESNRFPMISGV